ncbi:glycosyltransferase family 4 protein [Aurantimonas sp. Leaf443]|uniref:glycosyltransferase family 4 protein n=1 Tax=Aurantimonas sp. Leaf443 TaxID=1736378 RepID=UPI0006F8B10B|nr:glycosyltransferase family 4 protein [Aurantimonas sp. Leaf443]KQT85146.1 hypothetical protein ASG48_07670 [Aurantimonas sp. Leaf443]
MTRVHFLVPDGLDLPTGGYGYDRRIIAELREAGFLVEIVAVSRAFPCPGGADLADAARRLAALPDGALVLADGLAFGAMPEIAEREGARLNIVALCHHPLCLETGLSPEESARLEDSERRALAMARSVVVTAPATGREVATRFGVAPEKLSVALPGTDPAPLSPGGGRPPLILSIGTLIPRKGHDILIAALARLRALDWTCRIIGSGEADPATAADLRQRIAEAGLGERVTMTGRSEDTRAALAKADIFALASRYEGYGMVFAEAMSQGVPIVACAAGPIPDVVPASAGLLVPADDPQAFADALERLITDEALRARLAAGAAEAGRALPSWRDAAAVFVARLDEAARP